jgi:predicted negative regulator of RcsB-dependent stress response
LEHKAKVYMTDGNLPDAIDAVRAVLAIQFPAGASEAEDVRLDATALLAKLLLMQGNPEDAMKVVEQGIASRTRDSFFLANLYTVEGEVHEARAADLQGDAAKAEKKAAIESYDHSLQIDQTLQKQLTGESP